MEKHVLVMAWKYSYCKEGVWDDDEEGVKEFELTEGAPYTLPQFYRKKLEIRSVKAEDGRITAEIYADSHTYRVKEGEFTEGHAHNSYSVAGDSVSETLYMKLSIQ
jgi:hypothetical protein